MIFWRFQIDHFGAAVTFSETADPHAQLQADCLARMAEGISPRGWWDA